VKQSPRTSDELAGDRFYVFILEFLFSYFCNMSGCHLMPIVPVVWIKDGAETHRRFGKTLVWLEGADVLGPRERDV
jgi:hypothetical protein